MDLATMAGLVDVAVLAEAVNEDGTVKRLPDLLTFTAEHRLRIISIEGLIAHRLQNPQLIRRLHQERRTIEGLPATLSVCATAGAEEWQHTA